MKLRPYQVDAVNATLDAWQDSRSVLGVAATGLGKTVIAAHVIKHVVDCGKRVMVLAHREELIFQAAKTIERICDVEPDIEMGELRAAEHSLHGMAPVVISTIQTQVAGHDSDRMERFDPGQFGMVWIDEAHHAPASTYRRVLDHYKQNPSLRVLGVTATPDRTDEAALGQIFDSVAFEYDIRFGIDDGWLVPIRQKMVHVEHLDLSKCRTTAGDLNGADLASELEAEKPLHEMLSAVIEIACDMPSGSLAQIIAECTDEGAVDVDRVRRLVRIAAKRRRRTLIFAASLAHAEKMTEILNRWLPDSARWVHGGTPKIDRRQMLADYNRGGFQFLLNVGVATEGFDEPGIECVMMARPTKSRSLYTQMCGRGTRPLPGIIDDGDEMHTFDVFRRQAIIDSAKPFLEVVDFVGNAGRHKLISSADILAGNYNDDVVARAKEKIGEDDDEPADVSKALEEADREIVEEREAKKRADEERRKNLVAVSKYSTSEVDPFDAFQVTPWREKAWEKGKPISEKMRALLERQGVSTKNMTFAAARQIISEITKRWDEGKCSYKQARVLAKRGLPTDVSHDEAKHMIDEIAKRENWRGARR